MSRLSVEHCNQCGFMCRGDDHFDEPGWYSCPHCGVGTVDIKDQVQIDLNKKRNPHRYRQLRSDIRLCIGRSESLQRYYRRNVNLHPKDAQDSKKESARNYQQKRRLQAVLRDYCDQHGLDYPEECNQ